VFKPFGNNQRVFVWQQQGTVDSLVQVNNKSSKDLIMALTKDKKNLVVAEVAELLGSSKMTVVASYQGTPVKALQALRRSGSESGTKLKVIKNRLVIKAINSQDNLKQVDTSSLRGMLLYAFNDGDEITAAKTLAEFAKNQPTIQFVGAISPEGNFVSPMRSRPWLRCQARMSWLLKLSLLYCHQLTT